MRREVDARLVPTGSPIVIPEGAFVTLTQSLGGTYSVVFEGNMARIDGADADALGFERETLSFEPPADGRVSRAAVAMGSSPGSWHTAPGTQRSSAPITAAPLHPSARR